MQPHDSSVWIAKISEAWLNKDIPSVLHLFTDDVEYWETPFKRVENKQELAQEWSAITSQTDIELSTSIIAQQDETAVIVWHLTYNNAAGEPQEWAGQYTIKLNNEGLCYYFYQVGERHN